MPDTNLSTTGDGEPSPVTWMAKANVYVTLMEGVLDPQEVCRVLAGSNGTDHGRERIGISWGRLLSV